MEDRETANNSLYPKYPQGSGKTEPGWVTTTQKVVKTVFLVLTWGCLGLYLEITGPTLIDLKIRTHSNYEDVAFAVSGRSAGYFIGSAIGGVLVDRLGKHCDLMIALSLDGGAVATMIVPWAGQTWVLWFLCVCQGTFEGIINIAGQKLILEIWREKAASPLHILHGGFGIGSFIIPLIANPFLAVPNHPQQHGTNITIFNESFSEIVPNSRSILYGTGGQLEKLTSGNFGTTSVYNSSYEYEELMFLKESRIEYAYLISALITVTLSSVFFVYYCRGRGERSRKLTVVKKTSTSKSRKCLDMINPASCAEGRLWYGFQIFTVLFLHFFNCVGGERIGGKFIRAYSIDQLNFSTADGSFLNTVFWIGFSTGRIAGFFAANWIPIRVLIVIEATGCLLTTILLNIFAHSNSLAMWILTVPLGFFVAPLFPSGVGWGDRHVVMTGMGITTLLLGGSLGGIAYLRLGGYMFDKYGPRSFLYHLLGYGVVAVVLSITLTLIGAQHGDRFTKEKTKPDNEVDLQTEMIEVHKDVDDRKVDFIID